MTEQQWLRPSDKIINWNGPMAWRLAVTATDGGRHPQEKDKLSDKHAARYRTSAGRQAPERGGMGLGIEKEKKSQGGASNR